MSEVGKRLLLIDGHKTFRSEKFPEYKANRSATPDEFRSQLSFINELVDGFGIKHLEMPGFEADDIIATLSKQAEVQDFEILICTGDRDSFQLVSKSTTVLYPKKGVTEMNRMTPDSVSLVSEKRCYGNESHDT